MPSLDANPIMRSGSVEARNHRVVRTSWGKAIMVLEAYGIVEDGETRWYRVSDDSLITPSLFDVVSVETVDEDGVVREADIAKPFIVWLCKGSEDEGFDEFYISSYWSFTQARNHAMGLAIASQCVTRVQRVEV